MVKIACGVILRVFGRGFQAREFLRGRRIKTYDVWEEGEPAPIKGAPLFQHGGFMVEVSQADDAFQ